MIRRNPYWNRNTTHLARDFVAHMRLRALHEADCKYLSTSILDTHRHFNKRLRDVHSEITVLVEKLPFNEQLEFLQHRAGAFSERVAELKRDITT